MIILIPAYEPNNNLIKLIEELKSICDYKILIVDDGSGKEYDDIFEKAKELSCHIIRYEKNKGKGLALKTGFKYITSLNTKHDVVTCDCDGQHSPSDIVKISKVITNYQNSIILGGRKFHGNVPLKSKFGNTFSRLLFFLASGNRVNDTQTGLRGFSHNMISFLLNISGNGFEYEMNMLLESKSAGYHIKEIPIDTIYIENNKSTHFSPVKDSIKILLPIFKFCGISSSSAVIDFIFLMFLERLTNNLLFSVVGSRIISSMYNYTMNKNFVFVNGNEKIKNSVLKYYSLVILILFLNYNTIYILNKVLFLPLVVSKIIAEIVIFAFSYFVQKKYVFSVADNRY